MQLHLEWAKIQSIQPRLRLKPDEVKKYDIYKVSFQWKNPDFLLKNPDFLMKNPDFLLKNADVVINQGTRFYKEEAFDEVRQY